MGSSASKTNESRDVGNRQSDVPRALEKWLRSLPGRSNADMITALIAPSDNEQLSTSLKLVLGKEPMKSLTELVNGNHDILTLAFEECSDNDIGSHLSNLITVISGGSMPPSPLRLPENNVEQWMHHLPAFSRVLANELLVKMRVIQPLPKSHLDKSRVLNDGNWQTLQCASKYFLALEAESMGVPFRRLLYADWQSGRSLNTLLKFVRHYNAPSLIVFDDKIDGTKVVVLVQSKWDETGGRMQGPPSSSDGIFWGESLILSIKNVNHEAGDRKVTELMVLHEKNEASFYLNTKIKAHPMGIGIGGRPGMGRIFLDKDLADCYVTATCSVYAKGKLLRLESGEFQSNFQIGNLEVWGLGNAESYAHLEMSGRRDVEVRRQARLVDKSQLLDNDFNREMMMGAQFQKHDQRGITDE